MGILSPTYRCAACGEHTQAEGFGANCVDCWSLADAERMGVEQRTKFFGTRPTAPWVVWRD
jgi:hypothetical protein